MILYLEYIIYVQRYTGIILFWYISSWGRVGGKDVTQKPCVGVGRGEVTQKPWVLKSTVSGCLRTGCSENIQASKTESKGEGREICVLRWAGHVTCMWEIRNLYKIVVRDVTGINTNWGRKYTKWYSRNKMREITLCKMQRGS